MATKKKDSKKSNENENKTNNCENQEEVKRLYRSQEDKMIEGVCGGIAEYFNIDSVWVRFAAILLVFMNGMGIILYLVGMIIIPKNPYQKKKESITPNKKKQKSNNESNEKKKETKEVDNEVEMNKKHINEYYEKKIKKKENKNYLLGLTLIIIGSLFFMKNFFNVSLKILAPVFVIFIGLILVINNLLK